MLIVGNVCVNRIDVGWALPWRIVEVKRSMALIVLVPMPEDCSLLFDLYTRNGMEESVT